MATSDVYFLLHNGSVYLGLNIHILHELYACRVRSGNQNYPALAKISYGALYEDPVPPQRAPTVALCEGSMLYGAHMRREVCAALILDLPPVPTLSFNF